MTSPSTMMPPHSENVFDSADFPAPMPPVSPMRSIRANYALPASFSRRAASWASLASEPPADFSEELLLDED